MRARLGLAFAFLGLLVTVAPIGLAQVPAAAPIDMRSAPQGGPDVTEQTLYTFCSPTNCAYGDEPSGDLITDAAGNLYGTAYMGGGTWSGGLVYRLTPNQRNTAWNQTILYRFCSDNRCPDGEQPESGVIMDGA